MHSTLYSQNDSLYCLTVKQQNDNIAKLIERIELKKENAILLRDIKSKDSTVADQKAIIYELKASNELILLAYQNEKKASETAEKQLKRADRRARTWRNVSIIVGASGIVAYILK